MMVGPLGARVKQENQVSVHHKLDSQNLIKLFSPHIFYPHVVRAERDPPTPAFGRRELRHRQDASGGKLAGELDPGSHLCPRHSTASPTNGTSSGRGQQRLYLSIPRFVLL